MNQFRRTLSLTSILGIALASSFLLAGTKAKFNSVLNIGDAAPNFKALPGVDGKNHDLAEYAKSQVVVLLVICNHCPVAKSYEERMIEFAKSYEKKGVQVVALNFNRNKVDRLDAMKERAAEKKYPFPYLYDDSQKLGHELGATTTPHVFVLDRNRKIAYMGAFDDHNSPTKVQKKFVVDAVDALLAGREPVTKESRPRGCGIGYEDQE